MSCAAQRFSNDRLSNRAAPTRKRKRHELDSRRSAKRPKKVRTFNGERRDRPNPELAERKARKDIIWAMRYRFKHGIIRAMSPKDAIGQLFGKIKHSKRVIAAAFIKMLGDNDVLAMEFGYKLDPMAA
jgi:hypothetical protein